MTLRALPLCALDGCTCHQFHARDTECADCLGSGYGPAGGAVGPCQTCAATYRQSVGITPVTAARRARDDEWLRDRERHEDALDVEAKSWARDQVAYD